MVSAIATRVEPILMGVLYTQLVSFEQRIELLHDGGSNHSVNMATKGGRGGGNTARGHGGGDGNGRS